MATINEFYGLDIEHRDDFIREEGAGDINTIEGLENVKEALRRRLITRPGEVVHRPEYGVGLPDYLNAPATLPVKQALAAKIATQFARDPRVQEILGIQMETTDFSPDKTVITVRVKLVGYGEQAVSFIAFGDEVI